MALPEGALSPSAGVQPKSVVNLAWALTTWLGGSQGNDMADGAKGNGRGKGTFRSKEEVCVVEKALGRLMSGSLDQVGLRGWDLQIFSSLSTILHPLNTFTNPIHPPCPRYTSWGLRTCL